MKKLQLTLALCKPDITVNDFGVKVDLSHLSSIIYTKLFINFLNQKAIRDMIQRNNFYFIKSKKTKLTLEDAMKFYKEHESKNYLHNSILLI